jgi:hypothetical protein
MEGVMPHASYIRPAIIERGEMAGRTMGHNNGTTVEATTNFFGNITNDGLDDQIINFFSVDRIQSGACMTLDNAETGNYKIETLGESD